MNHDDIDVMLREYAPRWRAAQPPAPTADLALRVASRESGRTGRITASARIVAGLAAIARAVRTPRTWLPVVAAAVSIALVAGGIGMVRHYAQPSPAQSTPPSTSPGIVAWRPLPATNPAIPVTITSPSPDPAPAEALPPCRSGDLSASDPRDGAAGGTRTLTVTFRTRAEPCRLDGYPGVTPLDRDGREVAVPIERDNPEYGNAVALVGTDVAVLTLSWTSTWCAPEVEVATLRLGLSDGGGSIVVDGFGRSQCYGVPGSGTTAPIRVGEFRPERFTTGEIGTVFDRVRVEADLPATAKTGELMRFRVTLTAPAGRDVPLDPCPDFSITIGDTVTYGLNCPGVPYRDRAGRPYLPGGVPVTFAMQATAPLRQTLAAKMTWRLVDTSAVDGRTVDVLAIR
jgi:hypothetical protein